MLPYENSSSTHLMKSLNNFLIKKLTFIQAIRISMLISRLLSNYDKIGSRFFTDKKEGLQIIKTIVKISII